MYPGQVPKPARPEVRVALVERAATLLAAREPVTLRAVVEGTGASTMSVYTYFGGMPGLWRAVRQEGFTRLARHLADVPRTRDAIRDLAALGAAYVANALENPDLYRVMFDAQVELEDPQAAAAAFDVLVDTAGRARASGRLRADCDPSVVATQLWAAGHGVTMLVLTGVLPAEALPGHAQDLSVAVLVAAGDEHSRCRRSVKAGWKDSPLAGETQAGRTQPGSSSATASRARR
jgi:AcrR family transcriptional regulator